MYEMKYKRETSLNQCDYLSRGIIGAFGWQVSYIIFYMVFTGEENILWDGYNYNLCVNVHVNN